MPDNRFISPDSRTISPFTRIINRYHVPLLLGGMFILGFILRLCMARLDPFLHPWDEQFHALVARNMMDNPLKPLLRITPFAPFNPNTWCCNTLWLHKQPLFMWQMALSMKIFGVSEFTIRYSSVLMGSLMILMVYRLAFLLTHEKAVGLIAATFMCFSSFQLELISGRNGMDHNDVAFGFYILGSIWSYAEYLNRPKWYWIVLTGVFSGGAILNKWLTGLLVFLGWGFNMLLSFKDGSFKKELLNFLAALLVCCLVFLPWQLYILYHFPLEARYEYAYNSKHIWEAVEGHSGPALFYLNHLDLYLGQNIWALLLPGLIIGFWGREMNARINRMLLLSILFVFCFFSFLVQSKLTSYVYIIIPLSFIFVGITLFHIFRLTKFRWFIFLPVMLVCIYVSLNPSYIAMERSAANIDRNNRIHNARIYKSLSRILPPNIPVVVNLPIFEDVEAMFYDKNISAYSYCLNEDVIDSFKRERIPVAAFVSHNEYVLPDYILNYPYLYLLREDLK